jgi:hypothetical protein
VRGFLSYLQAAIPETEIPALGLLGNIRRPKPYLYSQCKMRSSAFRPIATQTLFTTPVVVLLACMGKGETITDGNTCLFAGSLCPLKRSAQKRPKFRNHPSQRFKEPFYDTDHSQRSGEPQFILSEPLLYRLKHGKRYTGA